jgi:hypothetical protein
VDWWKWRPRIGARYQSNEKTSRITYLVGKKNRLRNRWTEQPNKNIVSLKLVAQTIPLYYLWGLYEYLQSDEQKWD